MSDRLESSATYCRSFADSLTCFLDGQPDLIKSNPSDFGFGPAVACCNAQQTVHLPPGRVCLHVLVEPVSITTAPAAVVQVENVSPKKFSFLFFCLRGLRHGLIGRGCLALFYDLHLGRHVCWRVGLGLILTNRVLGLGS